MSDNKILVATLARTVVKTAAIAVVAVVAVKLYEKHSNNSIAS